MMISWLIDCPVDVGAPSELEERQVPEDVVEGPVLHEYDDDGLD